MRPLRSASYFQLPAWELATPTAPEGLNGTQEEMEAPDEV